MTNDSRRSSPATISKANAISNSDSSKVASLVNGILNLTYHESILQDSIKAYVVFSDVGNAIDGKSVVEGLPLIGTEDFKLEFEDNNEEKIKVNMNVNTVKEIFEDGSKNVISVELVSEEFLRNEMGDSRCRGRETGVISDTIEKIIKDRLKSEKELDIEQTKNRYNFLGNNRKPFYMLNLLSKQSVPNLGSDRDASAGFFFFETSKGYHFKSIEGLFKQKQKKSYVFNNSTDLQGIPSGYDGKILEHQSDTSIDVQSKMNMGTYKSKIVLFNSYNCKYEVIQQTAEEVKESVNLAGKDLPKFNDKFDSDKNDFTRTTLYLVDSGALPEGDTQAQIAGNEIPNFEAVKTLNQSIRRYNQFFSGMMTITIAGDFSLHAGDLIFVDIFSVQAEKDDTLNRESGGLYIIADLCHYIDSEGTYTKLNLARDSFGREGNNSKR